MKQHVTVVGILHIASGAFGLLVGMIVFAVLAGVAVFAIVPEDAVARAVLLAVGFGVPLFLLVLNVPQIIGGVFLLKFRPWARYLAIFYGAVELLSFPIGTAIGIYTLWVLVQDETAQLFASGSSQ